MHCFVCSLYETSTQRRRKKTLAKSMENKNKTKEINLQLLEFQLNNEPIVVLDQTIVNRYLQAKGIINEILKLGELKSDYQKSYSKDYEKFNLNSYQKSSFEVNNEVLRKQSTEITLTGSILESCDNNIPVSSIPIKDEVMDRESCLFYNNDSLITDAEVQLVEIPFNSNIVLNPMNNRFSFSQIDPIFVNNNEDDLMNGNIDNLNELDGPKYLYNPMNNIITSTQNSDDVGNYKNNSLNVMPADVQFSPGEYSMEDSLLNDNYNIINTFGLEPSDMEPTNQNTLSFMEHSSKKQDLTIQSVNAIVNPETKNDDTDLPKYDKSNISDACIKPLIMKQESILYNEMECKQDVKTDFDENICKKCQKKFKVIHYLRRHELTCGMTFHYNCLFCAKTSLLSHTIKCHMTNCHAEQVAVYGMKNAMNAVIKRRKENKEINMNVVLNKENQVLANIESYFIPMNNFENIIKNNKHEETISNDCKIKKELLEENYKEGEDFSNLQNNIVHINKTNIKPSKKYVEALCSNCNVYFTNLKSGVMKCCTHCQSPLIYKCAVCRKCFSKYLSICGHVKYHSKSNLCQIVVEDDKYYCGYCNYETIQKSQLLRHILEHGREKSVFKTKREYFK